MLNFRAVSRHELFPIRAPLLYLEHCIAPFLNKCDADNDHMVTLKEWSNCLEIPYVSTKYLIQILTLLN